MHQLAQSDAMAALWQAHYFVLVLTISIPAVSSQNIRLIGGGCERQGRVEVYYSSTWGTVCDDHWDIDDARVVCRQLGYPGALSATSSASFGQGSGTIWLDDVDCSGDESSLFSCSRHGNAIGYENCGHHEDAGVVCSDDSGVPNNVSVASVMSQSFQVSWSACSVGTTYFIDYRKSSTSYSSTLEVGSVTSKILLNLSPSTTYHVRVQCARYRGSPTRGSYSSTVSARTTAMDNAPSTPSVTVTTTSVSASVRWSCSGASRYFITYYFAGDPLSKMKVQSSYATMGIVRYLMPETAYTFQVICESMHGRTSTSRNVNAFTDSLVPTMFQVTARTTDAVASWTPPTRRNVVASYMIIAFSATRQSSPLTFSASASYPFQTTLHNLAPETVYSFQIQTVSSSEGKSAWSEPVIRTTLPIVPQEVLNVTEGETTDSTITITWERTPMTVEFYQLTIQWPGVINGSTTTAYESSVNVTSTTEMHTFRGLQPGTAHNISITAVNRGGAGPAYTLSISTESAPVQEILSGLSHQQSLPILSVLGVLLIFAASCLLCILALFCYQRRKPKHLGTTTAATTVNFSAKDDGVDMHMEDNMAYAGIEYRAAENDYHEDCPSIKDDIVLLSVPPRTKASEVEHPVYEDPMPMASCSKNTHKDPVKSDPTRTPVFEDFTVFKKYSGWFSPSLNVVLADKLSLSQGDFLKLGSGIFYMAHTQRMSAKYVGSSSSLPTALTDIMNELYCKGVRELSPIEFELTFNAPSANNWIIQVFPCSRKELSLEVVKKIIEKQTLRPHGLNRTLKVVSREDFDNLGAWHMEEMTAKAKSGLKKKYNSYS